MGVEDPLEMSDTEYGDFGLETQNDSDSRDMLADNFIGPSQCHQIFQKQLFELLLSCYPQNKFKNAQHHTPQKKNKKLKRSCLVPLVNIVK